MTRKEPQFVDRMQPPSETLAQPSVSTRFNASVPPFRPSTVPPRISKSHYHSDASASQTSEVSKRNFPVRRSSRLAAGKISATPGNPSPDYLTRSSPPPRLREKPQRLLIALDLNGTLLARSTARKHPKRFTPRPGVAALLDHLFTNHEVLVWTSMRPENAKAVCESLFSPDQHARLAAIWARDTLGLSQVDYNEKVQVYKRLGRIWDDRIIAAKYSSSHPDHTNPKQPDILEGWNQHNTLLLDDSAEKARLQPHNLLQLPEFTGPQIQAETQLEKCGGSAILPLTKVARYVDLAAYSDDVSAFCRRFPFAAFSEVMDRLAMSSEDLDDRMQKEDEFDVKTWFARVWPNSLPVKPQQQQDPLEQVADKEHNLEHLAAEFEKRLDLGSKGQADGKEQRGRGSRRGRGRGRGKGGEVDGGEHKQSRGRVTNNRERGRGNQRNVDDGRRGHEKEQ